MDLDRVTTTDVLEAFSEAEHACLEVPGGLPQFYAHAVGGLLSLLVNSADEQQLRDALGVVARAVSHVGGLRATGRL